MGLFSFFKKKTAEAPPKELGDVLASNIMDFSLSKSIQYIEDYIAIDFETTGLDYMSDKIIEIGAVHYNKRRSLVLSKAEKRGKHFYY